ncbi:DNA-binding IclR family transcriptional regulator [Allocatelliglobosispora scoriae]|uniref:DNA-binding IclR family transcriptional regulator n=1 Tax=Allocatelliglobosispora scoriae TaxID=643052 RepID=A0A841BWZ8_9ACTN|nr:DNA-binding IclR family transcriptional regulator [Allocatelliglobosispora scoriae]
MLEAVGRTPGGLTVKQIARRCELTVATTYHLVRTLAYEGYVNRREDGTYVVGLEVADRYRELVTAFRGPVGVGDVLRRAAVETGYSHYMASFVGGRVAITAVGEGPRSPYLEDLVPGFDDGAHATALGKSLLSTLTLDQRKRYVKDTGGLRQFTNNTIISTTGLEADIAKGQRHGMQVEVAQFRPGVACASVLVSADRELERRYVVACSLPAEDMSPHAMAIRQRLQTTAKLLASTMVDATV